MLMEQLILFLIGLLLLFTRVNNILDAINHLLCTVAFLGFPLQLKTDKGPAYTSKCFKEFCNIWNINHVSEIPCNPQGQTIVE